MRILSILAFFALTGCATFKGGRPVEPPRVAAVEVIKSLEDTKINLAEAGKSNQAIERKIDAALELSARLERLLETMEKDYDLSLSK